MMILDYFRRLFGINELETRITNLHDQRFQLEKLVGELTEQTAQSRRESAVRQRVMRDELIESEARLMQRIEELENVKVEPSSDTLEVEENKTGYTRWSERKRARAAAEADPSKWIRRLKDGDIPRAGRQAQDDLRRRNHESGDGKAQVS